MIVRATSFMTSLKPVYDYMNEHHFTNLDTSGRAKTLFDIVMAYWLALKQLNPDAFAKPANFVIQKSPGLFTIHMICKRLLRNMHVARMAPDETNFTTILDSCAELRDPDYWATKRPGVVGGEASKYGSMKGFAELADLLWESLEA